MEDALLDLFTFLRDWNADDSNVSQERVDKWNVALTELCALSKHNGMKMIQSHGEWKLQSNELGIRLYQGRNAYHYLNEYILQWQLSGQ